MHVVGGHAHRDGDRLGPVAAHRGRVIRDLRGTVGELAAQLVRARRRASPRPLARAGVFAASSDEPALSRAAPSRASARPSARVAAPDRNAFAPLTSPASGSDAVKAATRLSIPD